MAKINSISINISLLTKPQAQTGFGMPLFLGVDTDAIAYQEITDPDELLAFGYLSTDEEYLAATAFFSQSPRPEKMAVHRRASTGTITEALAALKEAGNFGWYGLFVQERTKTDQNEAATYANANDKLFMGASADATVGDGRTGDREFYILHDEPGNYQEVMLAGMIFSQTPGSVTFAYKTPVGITDSGLTETEKTAAETANLNHFSDFYGDVCSYPGKVVSGEFADTVLGRDYVDVRMKEALARLAKIHGKIPYTVSGFGLVESAVREVLTDAGRKGIIADVQTEDDLTRSDEGAYQYTVTIPENLSEIATNDRANRIIPVSFSYRSAGAVHVFEVTGTVTI